MTETVIPQAGEGWDNLLTTARFNGGDNIPADLAPLMDGQLTALMRVGIMVDGTPSVLFVWHPATFNPADLMVHWCNDGRTPLKQSLDLLGSIVQTEPERTWLAFVRRPALVRLLASRGWELRSHDDEPFMALMTCQPNKAQLTQ